MKKKLLKMRVCLGLDCLPKLDAVSYEDELSPEGNPYQSSKSPRNKKWEVGFGQVWIEASSASNEPYWDSYVILDSDGSTDKEAIVAKARELYESSVKAMKSSIQSIMDSVNGVEVPTIDEIRRNVDEKTGSGAKTSGRYVVPIETFKNLVKTRALAMGSEKATEFGFQLTEWKKFFDETITPDILTLLMKGLPVLKFNGDGIEFQTNDVFDQALNVVSIKLSSDVFARFVETKNGKKA